MKSKEALKNVQDKIKFMDKKTKLYFVICGVIVLLIIIIAIVSCAMKDKMYTYSEVEDKMVVAAKSYYKDNESLLPTTGIEDVLQMDTLVQGKYIKEYSRMLKDGKNCSGEIKVKNIDGTITYTPYLNCGTAYFSLELYKKIADETNVVNSGDGLYKSGTDNVEYIYRGQNVNNYVLFADKVWRIIKVTAENETLLIEDVVDTKISYTWDDRYNTTRKTNSGINDYALSRIKDSVAKIYDIYFNDDQKLKLSTLDLCVANRGEEQTFSSGKVECATMVRDVYVGLLDLYDLAYASLDSTCKAPKDVQCENYNYLVETKRNWWLMTATTDNTHEAYMIRPNKRVDLAQCNSKAGLRPVIKIKNEVFLRGGIGTIEDPYVIK